VIPTPTELPKSHLTVNKGSKVKPKKQATRYGPEVFLKSVFHKHKLYTALARMQVGTEEGDQVSCKKMILIYITRLMHKPNGNNTHALTCLYRVSGYQLMASEDWQPSFQLCVRANRACLDRMASCLLSSLSSSQPIELVTDVTMVKMLDGPERKLHTKKEDPLATIFTPLTSQAGSC